MNPMTHIVEGEFREGVFFVIKAINGDEDIEERAHCAKYFPDKFKEGKKARFRITITKI